MKNTSRKLKTEKNDKPQRCCASVAEHVTKKTSNLWEENWISMVACGIHEKRIKPDNRWKVDRNAGCECRIIHKRRMPTSDYRLIRLYWLRKAYKILHFRCLVFAHVISNYVDCCTGGLTKINKTKAGGKRITLCFYTMHGTSQTRKELISRDEKKLWFIFKRVTIQNVRI